MSRRLTNILDRPVPDKKAIRVYDDMLEKWAEVTFRWEDSSSARCYVLCSICNLSPGESCIHVGAATSRLHPMHAEVP